MERIETSQKEVILIVDDAPANIKVITESLKSDYTIRFATNGAAALKIVDSESPPDLVLLDIIMPEMDGYEVCTLLKANEKTREIPIIFISSLSETQEKTRGFEIGGADYITKPFEHAEMKARIRTHLQLKKQCDQLKVQRDQLASSYEELKMAAELRNDVERITRHDLKTPLNAVIGGASYLQSTGELNEEQKEWIQIIEESGYRMLNMVNLSLDLYKMEKGTYIFGPTSVNILPLINRIKLELENLAKIFKINPIQILIKEQPINNDSTFIVQAEELLCYTMFANLVKNAIEASPEQGVVRILLVECSDSYEIIIENQGIVASEIRNSFFEKYTSSGKDNKGTGLGTYSARLIARTQNGEISMKTGEDIGTRLIIQLPKIK
jgi:two-component system, sensor histidine kinase and response regulator